MKLQPSTVRDYRSIMNFHVLPHFGNWFINEILPVDVEEFMATRECGAKRVNNILVPLRSVFRMAKKNGFLERNIMIDVENLPVDRPSIHPLSMEEVVCFLDEINPHYRNFFITAFFTGMRLGEQIALKWKAVDWDQKTIAVIESRVEGIEGRPKTKGSYRDIVMLPSVEEALREQRRRIGLKSPYVFLNTDGKPIEGETLRKTTWTPTLKRAGLEYRSMYHTRHTFATLMLSCGENVGWVQQMMGHASLRMIQERYYRYIPNLTHADGSAFGAKFRKELVQVTPKLPQNDERDRLRQVIPLNR
ncbi:MAG: site-specific integrase [Desulfobacteraceae bacterium]|nr:site-specific integrase [Desulfobacteraceae bacterium]